MIFGYLMLVIAVTISAIAAWYSVEGLTAIFAAAVVPVIIMGGALEAGKIVATVWLHNNWQRVSWAYKSYLCPAIVFLMLLTSMGIFGFLSKAHSDQSLVSGDAMSKIAIYDEKIKTERDNIDANKKALSQMDAQVDQMLGRTDTDRGAERAVQIRKNQAKERANLQAEITKSQKAIQKLQEERAPLAAEFRKVEAEVGPIKYIAAFIYGDNPDQNVLERAVRWVIILIVIVFDPLALCLILAANKQLEWARHGRGGWVHDEEDIKLTEAARHKEEEKSVDMAQPLQSMPATVEDQITDSVTQTLPAAVDDQITDAVTQSMPSTALFNFVSRNNANVRPLVTPSVVDDGSMIYTEPVEEYTGDGHEGMGSTLEDYPELQTKEVPEQDNNKTETKILTVGDVERPGDYITPPPFEPVPVAAPGRGRGVISGTNVPVTAPSQKVVPVADTGIVADNTIPLGKASRSDFGNIFPVNPDKGDVYLRTDYLPNRLYKFNGQKWIEVDKKNTDVFAYDDLYIRHLIDEIDTGRYDPDSLTDIEREQIRNYLNKNAQ